MILFRIHDLHSKHLLDLLLNLEQISERFKNKPEDLYAFADKLEEGIKGLDLIHLNTDKAVFTKP